jgi:hypothetical protein
MQGLSDMRGITPQCWSWRGDTANGISKKTGMDAGFERHAGYHTTMLGLAWGHRQRYLKKTGMDAGRERHAIFHATMLGLPWGHRQRNIKKKGYGCRV